MVAVPKKSTQVKAATVVVKVLAQWNVYILYLYRIHLYVYPGILLFFGHIHHSGSAGANFSKKGRS